MIYILCAFETEARALIDRYKLQKKHSGPYKYFGDDQRLILISGMGQDNASEAITHLLLNFSHIPDDIFINLGVCAAQSSFDIGELVQIKKLQNEEESHFLSTPNSDLKSVSCFSAKKALDRPVNEDIAEMEAMNIYKTISQYFQADKISFLKVVSDNFNPVKPSKQFIISLMQNRLEAIDNHIQSMQKQTSKKEI